MVLNLLTISTVWLNSKAAQKVEFSPKYRHVKKPLWVLSGPICVINRSFIYLEVSISLSCLRILNIHNINSLKDGPIRVKNLKSGSGKKTRYEVCCCFVKGGKYSRIRRRARWSIWKKRSSFISSRFFPPSSSFSKHVRNSTSEYSEQSYIFGRKKGEICSFSLISWVFVRDGSSFPFPILMLRIG